jgi:Signal transduction histidine kinase
MWFLKNYFSLDLAAAIARRFLTILLLLLGCGLTFAQNTIDSLEAQLKKKLPDHVRVNTLLKLSSLYEYVDIAKSRELTEDAIRVSEKTSFTQGLADAHRSLGSIYRISGDFQSALKEDKKSLDASIRLNDSVRLARSYNYVAHDYFDMGEYDEAYQYFLHSYRFATSMKDSLLTTITLHNIGRVFKELGQFQPAKEYLKRSRAMSLSINDAEGEPYSLSELGDVMLREGKYDSALTTLLETIRLSRQQRLRVLLPKTMINIARIHAMQENYQMALAYYDSANELYAGPKDRYGIAEVNLGKSLVYLNMGQFDEAHKYITTSLDQARALNARVLELNCFQHLSALYEKRGDYRKALEYFKLYEQFEDTLFSSDKQSRLLRYQVQFETESKDSQIARLSLEQAEQRSAIRKQEFVRNILVVVMALSGILLITVYRSGQRRRKINQLLLQHQVEMEKRSEELEKLNQVKDKFFSIISHDLRSPINALSGLLDLMDKGAIDPSELSVHIKELRSRFNHTRTLLNNLLDWTLLQMDKLNLQAGKIDLHKIADENIQLLTSVPGKSIRMVNNIPDPAIAFGDANTINLVIRNLITNAIKFTNDGGEVLITGQDKGKEWLISVKDNGIGMKPEILNILFDKTAPYTTRGTANEKGTGLGLILCKEFIEKNGGRIWVESSEGNGSTFFFTLPKESAGSVNSF